MLHEATAAYWILCSVVVAAAVLEFVVVVVVVGDYSLLTLMAYNSTTVPTRPKVTMEYQYEVIPCKLTGIICVLLQ